MNSATKIKRSWSLALFGLPFFLGGAGFLFLSVLPTLYEGWQMQSWQSAQANLIDARLDASHSDNSTSYQVIARYQYEVLAQRFENDRVAISDGSDNVGDFQELLGQKLQQLHRNKQSVTIWYNPSNPAESIINRDIRWGLLGFKMILVIIFGGAGLGFIIVALKGKQVYETVSDKTKPWLSRPEWNDGIIKSSAKLGMVVFWGVAIIWNLISFPVAFISLPKMLEKQEYMGLFVLLFPLIGLGLFYSAIKNTLEWRRFGRTPLVMDPFPGSIGGDIGGSIKINMPYDADVAFKITLSCLRSYMSGSGKNRSRHEEIIWQDEGYARVKSMVDQIELQFRFGVEEGLPASEKHSSNYHLWRINVEAEMVGVDLDRSFEIPVYQTEQRSIHLNFDSTKEHPHESGKVTAELLLPIILVGNSKHIYYPMFRKPGRSIGLLIFGGIFAGVGVFLWFEAKQEGFMLYFMSTIFTLVGGAIVAGGFYTALNSLRVTLNGQTITSIRRLLGIPISQHSVSYSDVQSIDVKKGMSSSSGKKHSIEYSVLAKLPGKKITLAEHLDSASKKELVIKYFKDEILKSDLILEF